MTTRIGRFIGALAIAALLSFTAAATRASAQACTAISINNTTGVVLDLTFTNGVATHSIFAITSGIGTYPAPPFVPTGFISARGNFVSLAAACTGCITLQKSLTTGSICAHVCQVGPCSWTITQIPCTAACP
jgi:hypothetical protein